jgi:hypothetical protein
MSEFESSCNHFLLHYFECPQKSPDVLFFMDSSMIELPSYSHKTIIYVSPLLENTGKRPVWSVYIYPSSTIAAYTLCVFNPLSEAGSVDHCSISRIVAIIKLLLSTRLFFRSETKQGSAFCVFLNSHARSVSIGNTLPCWESNSGPSEARTRAREKD